MPVREKKFTKKELLDFYSSLILPRLIEEKMLILLRQGRISKWFSGIGQEAISVGAAKAMNDRDYIMSMHRNLGVFTTRNVDLYTLFCQLFGKSDGYTGGRDRSFHFGSLDDRIVGMISHLAAMLPVGCGLAMASNMKRKDFTVLAFCGEGSTSEGDFHEAMNLAAVWKLPVIFLVENNGYGLSTPVEEQYACESLADRGAGYGMPGVKIDGNNILEVYNTIKEARNRAVTERTPTLIEAMTFRMRGHEEASGTAYVPEEKFREWGEKDPIKRFEAQLIADGIADRKSLENIRSKAKKSFEEPLKKAMNAGLPKPDPKREVARVFASGTGSLPESLSPSRGGEEMRFIDSIQCALQDAFDDDEKLLIMGQDIAEYGGVFKVTKGFLERYGRERVRNTPIIESGVLGASLGLAYEGFHPIVEMQFADFVSCGFNQIINNIAKSHYRWSPPVNITIRLPHGAGVGAGPFHSQSPEGWFMQHHGLKIVVPATVEDAYALTRGALLDPNPVLIFEHKSLYRKEKGVLPETIAPELPGKAKIRRNGTDAVIITFGLGVHWAMEEAVRMEKNGKASVAVLDLRSLSPVDTSAIRDIVAKTSRVLLLQEASEGLGPMSEIATYIADKCFEFLDAPVITTSSLPTPVPVNTGLEASWLANSRLPDDLNRLLKY